MTAHLAELDDPVRPPVRTGYERAAWVLLGLAMLFVFRYHLVVSLVAGLLVYSLLHRIARFFRGGRTHGIRKLLAVTLLGLFAAGIVTLLVLVLAGFAKGRLGELPAVFAKMADIVDQLNDRLLAWGIYVASLDSIDGDVLRERVSAWLREHAAELGKAGGEVGRLVIHAVMGIAVGVLVFFRSPVEKVGPFAVALTERLRRFTASFEAVVFAQVEISALNTALTAVYLVGILPATGNHLPFAGTLVAVTFLAGLIPVVGNLISNTIIVLISLSVSPWVAIGSLTFLVVIHKLEYFVNAKIVGKRIDAQAWEILLAILTMEVAFGVAGVVLAPVIYAYVKTELRDQGLV